MLIQRSCPCDWHTGQNGTNEDISVHFVNTKKGEPKKVYDPGSYRRENSVWNINISRLLLSAPLSRPPVFHASLQLVNI